MVDERQITCDPATGFDNPWCRNRVQDNANFNMLACVLQPQNAKYGFIECASCLDYVVMDVVNCRVDWDACHEVWMTNPCPRADDLAPSEGAPISKNMDRCIWQQVSAAP